MGLQKIQRIVIPLASLALAALGFLYYGWPGVALVAGGLVMWQLLHFNRMLQVLKRSAHRPVGHVDSAVMLYAKLHAGMPLLHVIAMTRALGLLQTPPDAQPELFRWTDASGASVLCSFQSGKLKTWKLSRPTDEPAVAAAP